MSEHEDKYQDPVVAMLKEKASASDGPAATPKTTPLSNPSLQQTSPAELARRSTDVQQDVIAPAKQAPINMRHSMPMSVSHAPKSEHPSSQTTQTAEIAPQATTTPASQSPGALPSDLPNPNEVDVDAPKAPSDVFTSLSPIEGNDTLPSMDDNNGEPKAPRIPIGERLIKQGLISRDQLEIALKVQRDSAEASMIGAILVEMGFITESALGETLTESTGVEQFDAKSTIIDPTLIKQVPKEVALRYKAVPTLLENDCVYVAMVDIYNVLAIDRIQRYFPKRFKMVPVHCSSSDLSELIDNYYEYELSIDGILREMESAQADELMENVSNLTDGYTNPTVRLIDALLIDSIKLGASDVHFEPEGAFVRLRYRVDGKLRLIRSFHKDYWNAIAVRIKIMSDMNITETRSPQDGRISLTVLGRQIDFRVATQPTIYGENIVMRILDKAKALLPMPALGMSDANINTLYKCLKRPEGIIIVTGPTGSGKTTTLYSILSFINSSDVNIMTLEDPVEYQLPMIRQSNIREGTGMDFVGGIKSLMRQDPDIIFVGEVRDHDTATMALRAAMTGHQVYTSLHTNDALGAIPRLVDIGVKPRVLAGSIIAIVAQRLARKLCEHCKEPHPPTDEEKKVLGISDDDDITLYKHVGCDKCSHTGYKGRIGISEIISVDAGLDELIAKEASRQEMLDYVSTRGFLPMADDGIEKVKKGIMDLDELIRTINMTDRL